jgi:hypothetical protein
MVISLAINIYKAILNYYRAGELPNFSKKYIEEWRDRFHSIKDIIYKTNQRDLII